MCRCIHDAEDNQKQIDSRASDVRACTIGISKNEDGITRRHYSRVDLEESVSRVHGDIVCLVISNWSEKQERRYAEAGMNSSVA